MASDSDSSDEMKRIVKLSDIRTIRELYKSSVLKSPETLRYKPNSDFLNRVSLFQGDITELQVDSIVNAANKSLLGGGGVDGAIHHAAGRGLLKECRTLNGCETGFSKITGAYNLPSKRIIHTVGPVYSNHSVDLKAKQLASCYQTSLDLTVQNSLRHVAFPSISTGIYGYPIEDATHIALDVVRKHFESETDSTFSVIFVVWSNKDKSVYEALIPEYFPPSDDIVPTEEEESEGEPVPESQIQEDWEEVENVQGNIAENGAQVAEKENDESKPV
ncbi:A1pp-domain-containing protein [Gymnopus androsaceus JB14]|uniref:A1pp-domain-containing protein n=1 Tax=Gymnopus androsaceus JB14 TaxID=1447944 RepID=A0A6A4HHN9_9AGAR|nr:A1pp-domain-containing protein [Gymnopus androsaceus JB14]